MVLNEATINQLPYFDTLQEKELFINVVGALGVRIISLNKACEILGLEREVLLKLLDAIGVEFAYLSESDVKDEKNWK